MRLRAQHIGEFCGRKAAIIDGEAGDRAVEGPSQRILGSGGAAGIVGPDDQGLGVLLPVDAGLHLTDERIVEPDLPDAAAEGDLQGVAGPGLYALVSDHGGGAAILEGDVQGAAADPGAKAVAGAFGILGEERAVAVDAVGAEAEGDAEILRR